MNGFTEVDVVDQSGKCFLVTGANSGLGFEATRVLAARGARVLLACREQAKAEAAIERIKQITPRADLVFVPYDQADLDSVRSAVELIGREPRIDVLVNNAGLLFPLLTRTKQGFELQFGVNYLGCFALTALLLPKLAQTKNARVVVTSSIGHRNGKIDWDDINAEKSYNAMQRYYDSKLAVALFMLELDRRLRAAHSTVIAVGCHPGVAATRLGQYSKAAAMMLWALRPISNSAREGAWATLQAATDEVIPAGYYGPIGFHEYWGASGPASRTRQAKDPRLARRLWDISVAMTGIDPGLPPVC
ncbi:MAG: oxidoreductase [Pseudomonadota bacterium]